MQNHKYSLTDVEFMIPWEREIYISMLADEIRNSKEEQQKQQMKS
jgi:hypothetical protein